MVEELNVFYCCVLVVGQQGVLVVFDLVMYCGYDSDYLCVEGDVGKVGVVIDFVEDMKILFDGILLDKVFVFMMMNGVVILILVSFIVIGEEQGYDWLLLFGMIQNDILKEFMVWNIYIYLFEFLMCIIVDIIEYISNEMFKFNLILIFGYYMQEVGVNFVQELVYMLVDGCEYVCVVLSVGMDVDQFVGWLLFFFVIGMNFFMEVVKLCVVWLLWMWIMQEFVLKKFGSLMLCMYCQILGVSLQEQDFYNNVICIVYEVMVVVLGGM